MWSKLTTGLYHGDPASAGEGIMVDRGNKSLWAGPASALAREVEHRARRGRFQPGLREGGGSAVSTTGQWGAGCSPGTELQMNGGMFGALS